MTQSADVPEITATELKARLDRGEVPTLLDVRELFERRIADLPEHGQARIPTGEILLRMDELDRGAPLVIYCRSGSRSAWAARLLLERGFQNVLNLKGGVLAWREEVDPTLQAY
jgi:rhodanese-related sulfurtransferase